MGRPKSFKPLKRVSGPDDGAVYLAGKDGRRIRVTEVVQDKADGITEADYDFNSGKEWAGEASSEDSDD